MITKGIAGNIPVEKIETEFLLGGVPPKPAHVLANARKRLWRMNTKKALILSPLSLESECALGARVYARKVEQTYKLVAVAPQAVDLGYKSADQLMDACLSLISYCNVVFVCGNSITERMSDVLWKASEENKQIVVFNRHIYDNACNAAKISFFRRGKVKKQRSLILSLPVKEAAKLEMGESDDLQQVC